MEAILSGAISKSEQNSVFVGTGVFFSIFFLFRLNKLVPHNLVNFRYFIADLHSFINLSHRNRWLKNLTP